jgi:hypothetical protein
VKLPLISWQRCSFSCKFRTRVSHVFAVKIWYKTRLFKFTAKFQDHHHYRVQDHHHYRVKDILITPAGFALKEMKYIWYRTHKTMQGGNTRARWTSNNVYCKSSQYGWEPICEFSPRNTVKTITELKGKHVKPISEVSIKTW